MSFQSPEIGTFVKLTINQQSFFEKLFQSGGIYQIQDVSEENNIDVSTEQYFYERGIKSVVFILYKAQIKFSVGLDWNLQLPDVLHIMKRNWQ